MTSDDQLVGGKYRLVRRLGGGGMADVFLAQVLGASGFERTVVIKKMRDVMTADPELVRMFLDEAHLVARLHHANIAQVFDFGADASGHYLVMEYLDGGDARTLMRAASPRGGMALAHAIAIVAGAAAGLHHAHELRDGDRLLGLVHRDISPSNIMVTFDGGVKVIDFGIARVDGRLTRTAVGLVKGTVAYMSPEQVQGEPLDRRSDVFSLGVTLYELITSERPFEVGRDAPELAIMQRIAAGTFRPPSELRPDCPRELDALVARLLEVDRTRRPSTADAVVGELETVARAHGWESTTRELGRYTRELLGEAAAMAGVAPTLVDRPADDALAELLGGKRTTTPLAAAAPETAAAVTVSERPRPPEPTPAAEPIRGAEPTRAAEPVPLPHAPIPLASPRRAWRIALVAVVGAGTVVAIALSVGSRTTTPVPGDAPWIADPAYDDTWAKLPVCLQHFRTTAMAVKREPHVSILRGFYEVMASELAECGDDARRLKTYEAFVRSLATLRGSVEAREQRNGLRYVAADHHYIDVATGTTLDATVVSTRDSAP